MCSISLAITAFNLNSIGLLLTELLIIVLGLAQATCTFHLLATEADMLGEGLRLHRHVVKLSCLQSTLP